MQQAKPETIQAELGPKLTIYSNANQGGIAYLMDVLGQTGPLSDLLPAQVAASVLPFSFQANTYNPDFMIFASCIVAPTNNFTNGQVINWAILDSPTGHGSSFFTSAAGNGNKRLQVNFPTVRKVFTGVAMPDEGFASIGVSCGPTVAFDNMEIHAAVLRPIGVRLRGQGTTAWATNGQNAANFSLSAYSTVDGGTSFNYTGTALGLDYDTFAIHYMGPNNYQISRTYSGLGAFNLRFNIRDGAGALLTTNPTASDEILITGGGLAPLQVFLDNYATGNPNQYLSTLSNFWVFGLFEAWIVAQPINSSSVLVKYQTNYPSATLYKIYRDTQSSFATRVLVHTGTIGSFTDTGLSSGTLYYYQYVAVVGVDTIISSFNAKTY